jgi:hypothetical protein
MSFTAEVSCKCSYRWRRKKTKSELNTVVVRVCRISMTFVRQILCYMSCARLRDNDCRAIYEHQSLVFIDFSLEFERNKSRVVKLSSRNAVRWTRTVAAASLLIGHCFAYWWTHTYTTRATVYNEWIDSYDACRILTDNCRWETFLVCAKTSVDFIVDDYEISFLIGYFDDRAVWRSNFSLYVSSMSRAAFDACSHTSSRIRWRWEKKQNERERERHTHTSNGWSSMSVSWLPSWT